MSFESSALLTCLTGTLLSFNNWLPVNHGHSNYQQHTVLHLLFNFPSKNKGARTALIHVMSLFRMFSNIVSVHKMFLWDLLGEIVAKEKSSFHDSSNFLSCGDDFTCSPAWVDFLSQLTPNEIFKVISDGFCSTLTCKWEHNEVYVWTQVVQLSQPWVKYGWWVINIMKYNSFVVVVLFLSLLFVLVACLLRYVCLFCLKAFLSSGWLLAIGINESMTSDPPSNKILWHLLHASCGLVYLWL